MQEGAAQAPSFVSRIRFIVRIVLIAYIEAMVSLAQRIILADHARLPWRFFGPLAAVRAVL
jgi:hypothetical protein